MYKRILLTGANGFLGHHLAARLLKCGFVLIATGRGPCRLPFSGSPGFIYEEMDFTDPQQVQEVFTRQSPGYIIHAGAMTSPDACEQQREKAWQVNWEGTCNLLQAAERTGVPFCFLSTDFVFSGTTGMYREDEATAPVNYYGYTKAEAEKKVQAANLPWSIVRTVLVYGAPLQGRGNLLSLVKNQLEKGESLRVVDDQFRTPTFIGDLVNGICLLLEKKQTGIWHFSGEEMMTPYEMSVRTASYLGLSSGLLERVTAAEFPEPAKRPVRTGLSVEKAKKELGYSATGFSEGLRLTFGNGAGPSA